MTDSEAELIKFAQAGDTDAFCLLAQHYAPRIYLLALHYCHNAQDAEDLSQEVWLKAFQALVTFRGDASFYTWLRRITINCFLNHQRSRTLRWRGKTMIVQLLAVDSQPVAVLTESCTGLEETIYKKVLFERVMSALHDLTPSQRLMFLLRHHEGMSYEEISQAMGCSTGTAKKAVARSVRKLRAKLEPSGETTEALANLTAEC